jgi:Flp pilus assembly CpaF family ATPase
MTADTITFTAQRATGGVLAGVPGATATAAGNKLGTDIDALAAKVRAKIADRLPDKADAAAKEQVAAQLIRRELDQMAQDAMRESRPILDKDVEQAVQARVLAVLFGLGALQQMLEDPEIENIFVNGPARVFVRYKGGRRARLEPIASSDGELAEQVRLIAARLGTTERRFDRARPALSLQLPDGSRLYAVHSEIAGFTSLSIRRHRFPTIKMEELVELGTMDAKLARILAAAVRAKRNIIVAGETDSGKTTLLRALAAEIGPGERLITIEDTSELGLNEDEGAHPDVVAMQSREANLEGVGAVSAADLVRWSLRMSPDRIIVGECRSPEETTTMLEAMSVGNDGSLTTLHASSSQVTFARLLLLLRKGPEKMDTESAAMQIAQSAHLIVHLDVLEDGTRAVTSLREITGAENARVISNEIYRPGPDGRARAATPFSPATMRRLRRAGLAEADAVITPSFETGWEQ